MTLTMHTCYTSFNVGIPWTLCVKGAGGFLDCCLVTGQDTCVASPTKISKGLNEIAHYYRSRGLVKISPSQGLVKYIHPSPCVLPAEASERISRRSEILYRAPVWAGNREGGRSASGDKSTYMYQVYDLIYLYLLRIYYICYTSGRLRRKPTIHTLTWYIST